MYLGEDLIGGVSTRSLTAWKQHFKREDVGKTAMSAATATCDWLLRNKATYNRYSLLDSSEQWWPQTKPTSNEILIEERHQQFRASCFELGLLHYLTLLAEAEVPLDGKSGAKVEVISGKDRYEIVRKIARHPSTNLVLRELVKGREAKNEKIIDNDKINLKMLSDLSGYSPDTTTARVRDAKLLPLARTGILFGYKKDELGYSIEIGTIGTIFYYNVYFPILKNKKQIDPNL